MNENQKRSKQLTGIIGKLSGENQVIVVQKNNVIRTRVLKKSKEGGTK